MNLIAEECVNATSIIDPARFSKTRKGSCLGGVDL